MDIVWILVTGLAVGAIAKFVMHGDRKPRGLLLTLLLGIVGAFVGTFLGQFVGYLRPGEQGNFAVSVIGAIAVLFLWRMLARPRQDST